MFMDKLSWRHVLRIASCLVVLTLLDDSSGDPTRSFSYSEYQGKYGSQPQDFRSALRLGLKKGDLLLYRVVHTPPIFVGGRENLDESGSRAEAEGDLTILVTKATDKDLEVSWTSIDFGELSEPFRAGQAKLSRSGLVANYGASDLRVEGAFLVQFLLPEQPLFATEVFQRTLKHAMRGGASINYVGKVVGVDAWERYWSLRFYGTADLGFAKRHLEMSSIFDRKFGVVARSSSVVLSYRPFYSRMELKKINGNDYKWEEDKPWGGDLEDSRRDARENMSTER